MTSLILAAVLGTLNCGPLDQKQFPQYCACVIIARDDYKICLEREYDKCESLSCQGVARTKCSKVHQLDTHECESKFPPRK